MLKPCDVLARHWFNLHERLLMRPTAIFGVAILWLATLSALNPLAASSALEDDSIYEQLVALNSQLRDVSGQQRSAAVVQRYRELMSKVSACVRPIDDVARADDLFRATAFAELYSLSESDVDTLGCLYQELSRNGKTSRWHVLTYAGALVTVARYADANRLSKHVPDGRMPLLPELTAAPSLSKGWRFISLENEAHADVRNWTPLPDQLQIIAVVHPACAFSVRALADIESREDLRQMRDHLLLVVPPDASLPNKALLTWNGTHPDMPMHVMYTRDDWQALPSLDTPTFYLMSGTQLVQTFEGWPNADGVIRMQAAFSQ
ncbi:hypothetical protein [Stenotrophomonas sp. MMGLT7]|uniref:hypothetical protein n=1 Tax=Stenotrophomonas sp. MMGLT7 TaxID=2901227 RepID=UPI001E3C5BBA|nr:hypothetical protein [Stenotrophomonas sp. MMGLT7]MCD7099704.1 hypothetical protein [Stenotrophomonas sp. MMGLT7]